MWILESNSEGWKADVLSKELHRKLGSRMFQEINAGEHGGSSGCNEDPVELPGFWKIARGIQHCKF